MLLPIPLEVHGSGAERKVPLANSILIGLNVFAFLLLNPNRWAVGPGSGPLSLITYGFVHAGPSHFVLNMWCLWIFGNAVNRRIGNTYYTLTYFGTIIALGILAMLFSTGYLLGSSGAIFAMIAMAAMLMPAARVDVAYVAIFPLTVLIGLFRRPEYGLFWLIRWGKVQIPALALIAVVPVLELCGFVWWGLNWTNLGHLLGLVCGIAAVLLLPASISMPARWSTSNYER